VLDKTGSLLCCCCYCYCWCWQHCHQYHNHEHHSRYHFVNRKIEWVCITTGKEG